VSEGLRARAKALWPALVLGVPLAALYARLAGVGPTGAKRPAPSGEAVAGSHVALGDVVWRILSHGNSKILGGH
jgi:hypothetical protein